MRGQSGKDMVSKNKNKKKQKPKFQTFQETILNLKKFEKTKGWLSQKLSSSNQVDQFANILEERSIWQRYGF